MDILAIDKMRNMVNFFDNHSEYFNERFKTISQLEKVFDYAVSSSIEFLDDESLYGGEFTKKEILVISKILKGIESGKE